MIYSPNMVQNASDKPSRPTWKCPFKCQVTKNPCRHLERLLPQPSRQNKQAIAKGDMSIYADATSLNLLPSSGLDMDRFDEILSLFRLSEWQKEALRARFLEDMSWSEMVVEFGFTSKGAAHYFVKQTLQNMKTEAETRRKK